MNFQDAIVSGFKNYINFSDRASRSEYWFFILFLFISNIVVSMISSDLLSLWEFATALPSITISIRRLHDIDKTGWWIFLPTTVIGLIPYFIWIIKKGDEGENRFGSNPL